MNSDIPVKILFLAADPSDESRLRLFQELRDIKARLQIAKLEKYQLEQQESVRVGDITQAIFDIQPQIIHFSGHGKSTSELCFENEIGKVQPVKMERLFSLEDGDNSDDWQQEGLRQIKPFAHLLDTQKEG